MSKKTSYLLGILLTIILGTILYYFFCCNQCCGKNAATEKPNQEPLVETPQAKEATKNAFSISDEKSDFNLEIAENFNFKTSNYTILEPVSKNVEEGVLKLKNYLINNPLKDVEITGFYKSDEENNSAYPNLGLARANAVKNYLVLHGVPAKQIDTFGKLNDAINPDDANTLYGPLNFSMLTIDASDTSLLKALEQACDSVRANPLVLHFKTGQAAINLTEQQRQKIANISHCVDKLGVKVQVVGHTDNTGNANNNVALGKQRADFAKGYLVKNGILEQNIETSSKGPHEPIADNATEEGRAQNRRTVVTIN
ncbi:OmpA family protein [Seonamhaeicola algicola]|uniref:OmpA family protein n=1 Tax=Seonamhaeicola algicola TaxID=1719036 RepID=A0A5C7AXQ5_9FLAO|nr:OmpA family protein [Seonamhaeicola algicola]TXE12854.1 OmpA family protein [Seonamhaeicola algicola]